ncbi:hypothetical protein [Pontimicrobium sp. MEBiC06410]
MKNKKKVQDQLAKARHRKDIKRRKTKKENSKNQKKEIVNNSNIGEVKYKLLSDSLKYIADCGKTKILEPSFYSMDFFENEKTFTVPMIFSLVANSDQSFTFIKDVINSIYHNKVRVIVLDYSKCEVLHIGAQLYFDILLRDIYIYARKLSKISPKDALINDIDLIIGRNDDIRKILYSIGSFAIHNNETINFDDIVPYKLCEFKKNKTARNLFNIERKEKDVTDMVQYVIDSLDRMDKELTGDSIENLSIIIGEILINAEEHSTDEHRFSIGYFQGHGIDLNRYGIFNLVIFNFGETIYDKFKDPNCERQDVVDQMKDLSRKYTENKYFSSSIKEETLWTLYALQEEVTSVSPHKNVKRGNGSIKFIESFFNLKGENDGLDNVSRLAILSGNTSIVFDGTYGIKEKNKGDDRFKVMTFNESGNIADKPDPKYVKFVKNHFPGTIISAQILISKNDIL